MKNFSFEGEQFNTCHKVRNNEILTKGILTNSVDVVIVGAGISGLTSAYKLKDEFEIIVLEKEPFPGGASRRGKWNEIFYSYGAADTGPTYEITSDNKPFDFLADLFKNLNIKLKKVPEPTSAFMYKNELIVDPFCHCEDNLNLSINIRKSFRQGFNIVNDLFEKYGKPIIPPEQSPKIWRQFDYKTFYDIFSGLDAAFLVFLERFCEATFGESSKKISAFKGLYYFGRELGERFSFPGGNAYISEKLQEQLKEKILCNSTVISIVKDGDSYLTTYNSTDGSPKMIKSKSVIIACGKQYVPYIVKNMLQSQLDFYSKIRYNAFIVANIFTDKILYNSAFATYFDDAFFADMVIADWIASDGGKKPNKNNFHVYTLYCPISGKNRGILLSKQADFWVEKILNSFSKYFPGINENLVDIKLFRYGHHYVLAYPGFITDIRPKLKQPFGKIFFAKDDTQGIPSLESAVWSGIEAANDVRNILI